MKNFTFLFLFFVLFSCNPKVSITTSDGKKTTQTNYVGDGVVKKISLTYVKDYSQFRVTVNDFNGDKIEFETRQLTYSVGDTIHMDAIQGICYPVNDPTNIAK